MTIFAVVLLLDAVLVVGTIYNVYRKTLNEYQELSYEIYFLNEFFDEVQMKIAKNNKIDYGFMLVSSYDDYSFDDYKSYLSKILTDCIRVQNCMNRFVLKHSRVVKKVDRIFYKQLSTKVKNELKNCRIYEAYDRKTSSLKIVISA